MVNDAKPPRVLSAFQAKWMLNLYPPLLFHRVRVVEFGPDFQTCRVEVVRSRLTRNLQGTTFGGTIFCAADPIYAIMYWQIFAHRGQRVQAWLKSATIRYLKPAASTLTLEFRLSEDQVAEAAAALEEEGRFARAYSVDAVDRSGNICASAETEVYIRRPRAGQKELSAF